MDDTFLNDIIDERVSNNIEILHKSKNWRDKNKEYLVLYESLFNSLDKNVWESIEKLMYLKLELLSDEVYVSYKTGFIDGIKLNEQFGNSRN